MARKALTANDIADWFINAAAEADGAVTPLKLHKLIYFGQAWHLANTGRPLFAEHLEAWSTGPMVRAVFERFEYFGERPIPAIERCRMVQGQKLEVLELVQARYGHLSLSHLEYLAQDPAGPWAIIRGAIAPEAACHSIIPNDAIESYYAAQLEAA